MKKLLSKIDHQHQPAGQHSGSQGSVIGKSWTLKKYTISVESVLAEGGFGVVYLATQQSTKYALKRIIVNNDIDLAVASREIQIMNSLGEHPNLLACMDYLITPLGGGVTEALILMPYCRGSLLALINTKFSAKTHLAEKEVYQIMADIVSGLARLHQCTTPIIHRDLKIENILEDDAGKFLICDFGSSTAKFWDPIVHGATATQEDLDKYTTLAYRAPEMVDLYNNSGPITCKSDIWALGVLMFKMCFMTTPFGDSILGIQSSNFTFPPNSPYSNQLHSCIHYLLTPDVSKRPDIYQFADVLFTECIGIPNPITNVNGTSPPPSVETLINKMQTAANLKLKSEEKTVKSASSVTACNIIETTTTTVTPRNRPKPKITAPGPGTSSLLPCPPKSPTFLPPPKSPTKTVANVNVDINPPPPLPSSSNNNNNIAASGTTPTNNTATPSNSSSSSSNNNNNSLPPPPGPPPSSTTPTATASNSIPKNTVTPVTVSNNNSNSNDIGHRRNASDTTTTTSNTYEKGGLSVPPSEMPSSTSEQAISSWNPFEDTNDFEEAAAGLANLATATTTATKSNSSSNSKVTNSIESNDDDPFIKAPFDYFKYQPMAGVSVDLFGQAPFSNPFLEFSPPPSSGGDGVTNLSFEDER